MTKDQERRVRTLIETNGGKRMFNLGELSKMTGIGVGRLSGRLQMAGIQVARVGASKLVRAEDVILFEDTITCLSPVDNMSRGYCPLSVEEQEGLSRLNSQKVKVS